MTVTKESSLALRIARCVEVDRACDDSSHPCHTIVGLQLDRRRTPNDFQVPEGWAGNLSQAKIVFVASNPSINDGESVRAGAIVQPENYPRHAWNDDTIANFVTRRFGPETKWTQGDRFRCQDGLVAPFDVRFWARVRDRAQELVDNAKPEQDYVMTEVVHCKSRKEKGVARAAQKCFELYFEHILGLSSAPLVVVLGSQARNRIRPLLHLGAEFGRRSSVGIDEQANLSVRVIGGQARVIAYLWHPTGMMSPRTFACTYPKMTADLSALVRGEIDVEDFPCTDRT